MHLQPVLDVGGLLVSSFVVHAGMAIATLLAINPLLAKIRARRVIWNLPLAEFGILVGLIGLYTILL
ncbi:DUF1656 domain-containing protein [Acetobacter sp. TBRC 12305]|uniref:DUF1656 domain-containing protein n=1 Tax=Acetobacter garciniae TaxID=2817435 RepID=A0A939HQ44_9PROT|nr:DUF1656 domain-containing protein [Acetobacter garciniae]MBX0345898.1 DUF1656 domain-containing protein [Acetobacter garciniae]